MMALPSDAQQFLKPLIKSQSARKLGSSSSRSRNSASYGSLFRHLPKQSGLEKEQLYLETLTLRVQLNNANDEITSLKAKVKLLKKDLGKANELIVDLNGRSRPSSTQLVSKLKNLVHALKSDNESQRTEIDALKKKMRVTQFIELEAEKQVYVSECTRLRRRLDEMLRPFGTKENFYSAEADKAVSDALKKEVPRIKKGTSSKRPKKRTLDSHKKKPTLEGTRLSSVQEQLAVTQRQLQETKEALELERRSRQDITSRSRDRSSIVDRPSLTTTPDTLANSFIQKLHMELRRVKKDLETVLCAFSSHDLITADVFHEQLLFSGLTISEPDVKETWRAVFKETHVSLHMILTAFSKDHSGFDLPLFDSISREKLSDFSDNSIMPKQADKQLEGRKDKIMSHIALRMQLHRVSKEDAAKLVMQVRNASPLTQKAMLADDPFELKTEDERNKFLKATQNCLSTHEIAEQLGNWTVLEDAEEERFDTRLTELLKSSKDRLISTCELYDRDQSGTISLVEFYSAAKSCGLEFEPRLKMYITLLSYSFEHKLDSAPYSSLIEAFAKESDEESLVLGEISEEEQEQIVMKILKDIVKTMHRLGVSLKSVFETTDGMITPNGLLDGLNALLTEKVKKREFLVLLATLQSDRNDEPMIEFSDLEAFVREIEGNFDEEPHIETLISLLDSPEDLQAENESFVVLEAGDPVKMSNRAMVETEAMSSASGPRSY